MPPRTRSTAATFHSLPLPLALRIFALLPVDARLLAAAVCRAWRAMLAERSLWTRLDLAEGSGVARPKSIALLRAAAARAGGQLESLRYGLAGGLHPAELLAVVAENEGTLRELKLVPEDEVCPVVDTVEELLRAAPGLRLLETSVHLSGIKALPLLRKQPPFGPPLRLTRAELYVHAAYDWHDVAHGLAMHTSLESAHFTSWPVVAVQSDAVVSALLLQPQLRSVSILTEAAPVHVSVLAGLAGIPTLRSLRLSSLGSDGTTPRAVGRTGCCRTVMQRSARKSAHRDACVQQC